MLLEDEGVVAEELLVDLRVDEELEVEFDDAAD